MPPIIDLTCAEARAIMEPLLPGHLAELDSVLLLVMDNEVELDPADANTPTLAAAAHIGNCPACRAWLNLDGRYPERGRRRKQMARYCCFSMFEAVTGQDLDIQISSVYNRDFQLGWLLNDSVGIRFCPWCGTKLPDQPFESEE